MKHRSDKEKTLNNLQKIGKSFSYTHTENKYIKIIVSITS